jgi:hypothetical protein
LDDGVTDFDALTKMTRDFRERVVVKVIGANADRPAEGRRFVGPSDLRDNLLPLAIPNVEIGAVSQRAVLEKFPHRLLWRVGEGDSSRLIAAGRVEADAITRESETIVRKKFEGAGEKAGPLLATVSWLAAPFLLKWALLSRAGSVAERILTIFKNGAVAVLLLFICIYALYGIGATSAAQQAAALTAAMRGETAAVLSTEPHWSIFALQILLCLCTSTALTVQIRELMLGRTPDIANPNRQRLEGEVMAGHFCLATDEATVAPQRGHLAEYQACCARFIAYGEQAWRAAQLEQELILRHRQSLEQQLRLLEG